MSLKDVQDLCPALDLLQSAIRDTNAEAQSRQFCEQLLSITLTFLNTQIRVILTSTPGNIHTVHLQMMSLRLIHSGVGRKLFLI